MFLVGKLLLSATVSVIVFSLWKLLRLVWYHPSRSPLRHLRGPKGASLILGNLGEIMNDVRHRHPVRVFKDGLYLTFVRRMACLLTDG